ncbi:hypothetical protein [Nocardia sp. BMG111209]|uniref:hypothetical protein n=1 Tax=Nocardia sp. BMG111209 TaxID=1160137 RepID=UPI0012DDCD8F|nr:hypothetical protein [Nocardia sp. BMG111209]
MRSDGDFPAEWGRTLVGEVFRDPDDEEWTFDDWQEITFPSVEDGRHGHHTSGSVAPDTVAIALDGEIVALGETGGMTPTNLYVYDTEYYQFLRLRAVLDPERWASLPWGPFRNGQLLYAWDKFHRQDYFRYPDRPPAPVGYGDSHQPGDAAVMTYGGDWYDLAQQVEREYPLGYRAEPAASSEACLIRATQDGDLAAVREQLALGTNPDIGAEPAGVHTSFCTRRASSPLAIARQDRRPEITRALISAGADERAQNAVVREPIDLAQLRPIGKPSLFVRLIYLVRPDLRLPFDRPQRRSGTSPHKRWWKGTG